MKYLSIDKQRVRLSILLFLFITVCSCAQLKEGQQTQTISGGEIWYQVVGNSKEIPMLILHGGPGGTSSSLYPLTDLCDERQLIIFDQLGTGKSGSIQDTSLFKIDYFVEQLHEFICSLKLDEFYLYGHSWGTMLGLDYYLKYPGKIKALILNSPLVSSEMWMLDADTLKLTLPEAIQIAIDTNEANGSYNNPAYQQAIREYSKRFIWRNNTKEQTPYDTPKIPGNRRMYHYMWGPSEFNATGNLKNYDRIDELAQVKVPTLFLTGEFDEARPTTVKYFSTITPGAEFAVIPNAGHASMHDNRKANVSIIRKFLNNLDDRTRPTVQ